LILTADDFGCSPEVNSAVVEAFRDGVLRYASLMVNRAGAQEAARLARANPGLGVGLHLELCADNPAYWGLRYAFGARDRARLEGEIVAQIERMLGLGLKPTHVDSHLNIHVHPVIFPILARLARRYGITRLRLPSGELGTSLAYSRQSPAPRLSPSSLPYRLAISGVFGALGAALRGAGKGLEIPRSYGLLHSGLMTEDYLLWLISRLPEGLTEIYLHPSSDPGSAVSGRPTPTHQSITELRSLLSSSVRPALEAAGVSLATEAGAPPSGAGSR
jgi:hypothetical protein